MPVFSGDCAGAGSAACPLRRAISRSASCSTQRRNSRLSISWRGLDPRLVLVRCLCLLLLAGNQAQGEQSKVVGGKCRPTKVLRKLIHGKHLLCRRNTTKIERLYCIISMVFCHEICDYGEKRWEILWKKSRDFLLTNREKSHTIRQTRDRGALHQEYPVPMPCRAGPGKGGRRRRSSLQRGPNWAGELRVTRLSQMVNLRRAILDIKTSDDRQRSALCYQAAIPA